MDPIRYREPKVLEALVKNDAKANKAFFEKIKKNKPKDLDEKFHVLHRKAFEQFNCLDCANCCSGISPIILQEDIDRIAKYLKIKSGEFIQKYLYMDEDGDFVFQQTPCPFLGKDNYCNIYENRPKACREYPHTDRRKMIQILDLTRKNCEVCPVVYKIVKELKKEDF